MTPNAREGIGRVKRATVALAFVSKKPHKDPRVAPFLIVGSGFCMHPRGVIVTCEHVINAFLADDIHDAIASLPAPQPDEVLQHLPNLRMWRPHALFFVAPTSGTNLYVLPTAMEVAAAKTDYDMGALRVTTHTAFPDGYPYLEPESFANVHEGMEIATCGFPLGNDLQVSMGTMTSSFTRGIISSMIPAAHAREDFVTAFQLDLTATFGNSGGPVFSWASGGVIGVLQSGPRASDGSPVPGLARAESIYRLLRDGLLDRVRTAKQPSS